VAMGVAFLFARHEGGGDVDDQPAAAPSSHEMPYGPFLGLAAGVVMLIQDQALGRFGPGVEALWHTLVG